MKSSKRTVLISTFGSIGSLNPFLSIAFGLRGRGHKVMFAVEENLCDSVREAGFPVHTISGDAGRVFQQYGHELFCSSSPVASNKIIVEKWILPKLRKKIEELRTIASGTKLIVSRSGHLAAPIVSELTGVPWVQVTMTPFTIPSLSIEPHPLPIKLPRLLEPLSSSFGWFIVKAALRHIVDKKVNRIRSDYGLTKGCDHMTTGNHSKILTALAFSPAFYPNAFDLPTYARITGSRVSHLSSN